ncbi:MAG: tetratricopeptide repeat protein [Candidatus Sericytochromatia bacterium]|nr:tetratricopeptide repeat protein [Candidatus Sericytochromatia bacterium]
MDVGRGLLRVGLAGALVVASSLPGAATCGNDPYGLVPAHLVPAAGGPLCPDTALSLQGEAGRARLAIAARALPQALERLVRAVLVAPEDAEARLALGATLLAQGHHEAALSQLAWVAGARPADDRLVLLIATAEAGLGRTTEALERLEGLLARRPGWAAAHARRGAILAAEGDAEGARAAFARVGEAPLATPGDLVEAANHHLDGGRPREALALLERALSLRPDDSWAANNMGNAYRALGDTPRARASYERAAAADPTNPNPLNGLGSLLEAGGDARGALRAYMHAVAIDGDYGEARYNAGVLLLRLGRPREARRQLASAVRLLPGLPAAHYYLALALLRLGQRTDARQAYTKALALDPEVAAPGEPSLRWLLSPRP